jgi:hypothetical protein
MRRSKTIAIGPASLPVLQQGSRPTAPARRKARLRHEAGAGGAHPRPVAPRAPGDPAGDLWGLAAALAGAIDRAGRAGCRNRERAA